MTRHFMTTTSALALSLALSALPAATHAQERVIILDEVIVTASTTPTDADATGAVVNVVDAEELTAKAPTKLTDGLAQLPGVSASADGGLGKSTNLRIRGLSSQYVGVRINGIDVSDPSTTQTQFNWGSLSGAGLQRVEVLKGSQSALYGSEAIGGVISVFSKRPEDIGTSVEVGIEFGSFDTVRTDTTIATKGERGEISLTLSNTVSSGFSAADENQGNTEADDYDGFFALVSGAYDLNDSARIGLDLIFQDEATNIDNGGGAGADADRPFYTERFGARTYIQFDAGAWQHEFALSTFTTKRQDPTTAFGSGIFDGERTEVSYKTTGDLGLQTLSFGADYSEETARFDNGTFDYSVASIFGEVQGEISGDLDYSAALRIDDHSEFGTHTTGRFALAYRPAADTVIRTAIGSGFRAPSLNELFGPFNTTNPTLDPETSRSFELGIEHTYSAGSSVEATWFYTEIDNLIGFGANGYEQVPGTSVSQGIEFATRYEVRDGYSLFGAYTYTDAQDASGNQLRRVPRHDLVLGIDADVTDRLSARLSVQHIADRADDGFPSTPMADYTLVNASFEYQITETSNAYLRIENLTDEDYQTSSGFGTSDRAAYFGIRASF